MQAYEDGGTASDSSNSSSDSIEQFVNQLDSELMRSTGRATTERKRVQSAAKRRTRPVAVQLEPTVDLEELVSKHESLSDCDEEKAVDINIPFPSYSESVCKANVEDSHSCLVENCEECKAGSDKVDTGNVGNLTPATLPFAGMPRNKNPAKELTGTQTTNLIENLEGRIPVERKGIMQKLTARKKSNSTCKRITRSSSTPSTTTQATPNVRTRDRNGDATKSLDHVSQSIKTCGPTRSTNETGKKTSLISFVKGETITSNFVPSSESAKEAKVDKEKEGMVLRDKGSESKETTAKIAKLSPSHGSRLLNTAPERRRSFCKQDSLDITENDSDIVIKKPLCRQNATAIKGQSMPLTDSILDGANSSPTSAKDPKFQTPRSTTNAVPISATTADVTPDERADVDSCNIGTVQSTSEEAMTFTPEIQASKESPCMFSSPSHDGGVVHSEIAAVNVSGLELEIQNATVEDPEAHNTLTKQGSFPFSVTLNDELENSDSDSQSKIITNLKQSKRRSVSRRREQSMEESGIDSPLTSSYGFQIDKIESKPENDLQNVKKETGSKFVTDKVSFKVVSIKREQNKNIQFRSESVDSGMGNEATSYATHDIDNLQAKHSKNIAVGPATRSWIPLVPGEVELPPPLSPAPSNKSDVSETHSIYNYIDFDDLKLGNPLSPLPPSPVNVMEGDGSEAGPSVTELQDITEPVKKDIKAKHKNRKNKKTKKSLEPIILLETEKSHTKVQEPSSSPKEITKADSGGDQRQVIEIEPMSHPGYDPLKRIKRRALKRKSSDTAIDGPAPKEKVPLV